MTSRITIFFLICLGMWTSSGLVSAAEVPPNWPWRGVVVMAWGEGGHDSSDVARLRAVGANAVELSLSVRHMARFEHLSAEEAWQKSLRWADRMLDACKQQGMTGILSFVEVPIDPNLNVKENDPAFWDDVAMRSEAISLAGKLAAHFKDRGEELGAYELLNEPLVIRNSKVSLPEAWPNLRMAIIKEIRKHDPSRFVIVTPGVGGLPGGYRDFVPLAEPRIIYGAHVYEPHDYTHQGIGDRPRGITYPGYWRGRAFDKNVLRTMLAPLVAFKTKYGALVFIGEFSAVRWANGANRYLVDLLDSFDENGFSWMYFSYNGWHGWSPFYDDQFSTDKPQDRKAHFVGEAATRWRLLSGVFTRKTPPPLTQ